MHLQIHRNRGPECLCEDRERLADLNPGEAFIIESLEENLYNSSLGNRLRQLGFDSGNRGLCLYQNMGKGSSAYRICGSVIALRREDAEHILIKKDPYAEYWDKNQLTKMSVRGFRIASASAGNDIWNGRNGEGYRVFLAGNPNVGKSTIFNKLTGMHQHTGNWPGKTVELAEGQYRYHGKWYELTDLPGTYSLEARSAEEKITAEAILSGKADLVIAVADACCLEKSLYLAMEIRKTGCPMILCINLWDEARRKGIEIDLKVLEQITGCRVVRTSAVERKGLDALKREVENFFSEREVYSYEKYEKENETDADESISGLIDSIMNQAVVFHRTDYWIRDYRIDRFLTGSITGTICFMFFLFSLFWLTIIGANYPSDLLAAVFNRIGSILARSLSDLQVPSILSSLFLDGIWRVVSWVVSVMLPPMMIFFPLFTILEDLGYLPRIAFHLDGCFRKCQACGKQALTMCMGLGCNAVGVTGCRIIDTEKERKIAILTNSLMPCNGRYPALIAITVMFFAGGNAAVGGGILCMAIGLTFLVTFLVTFVLSQLIRRNQKTTFILELPPYRKPQISQILFRSVLDRTFFVLGRAIMAAAPAGAVIWLLANLYAPEILSLTGSNVQQTWLQMITSLFDPAGRFLGLDGAILFAFILGFPANEIVLPSILMCYLSGNSLMNVPDYAELKMILLAHGWTLKTAVCMILFTLFHWPCATTCLTIKKETGSNVQMLLAILIPTVCGILLCSTVAFLLG